MTEQARSGAHPVAPLVALVTGGAQRIGAEICRQLHSAGYDIALHYNSSDTPAKKLAAELNQQRENSCACFQANLTDTAQATQLATEVLEHFSSLSLLVNNASSFYPTAIGTATEEDWDKLIGSNVKGPFFLSQALIEPLRQTHGSIVNIVDIHAERPLKNYTVYGIAKAGVAMMTKSLARDLAPDIRVNGVAPGAILWPEDEAEMSEAIKQEITKKIPMKRPGNPADIAETVVFLATGPDYITGQIIAVDGGRLLNT